MMKLIKLLVTVFSVFAIQSVYANLNQYSDKALRLNIEFPEQYATQVGFRSAKYRESRSSVFPRRIKAPGERVFIFSPRHQSWAAYSADGNLVGYGRGNGGANFCRDIGRPCRTPIGSFRVRSKGSPDCRSSKYPLPKGGAPMPYCMHFLRGYAIHGSPGIANYNSSHGCIRVYTQAASWLSQYFMKHGTRVIVTSY